MVERRMIGVVVGFKDRLTRFGFKYLERYFFSWRKNRGGWEPKEVYQEPVEDLTALASSFA